MEVQRELFCFNQLFPNPIKQPIKLVDLVIKHIMLAVELPFHVGT